MIVKELKLNNDQLVAIIVTLRSILGNVPLNDPDHAHTLHRAIDPAMAEIKELWFHKITEDDRREITNSLKHFMAPEDELRHQYNAANVVKEKAKRLISTAITEAREGRVVWKSTDDIPDFPEGATGFRGDAPTLTIVAIKDMLGTAGGAITSKAQGLVVKIGPEEAAIFMEIAKDKC